MVIMRFTEIWRSQAEDLSSAVLVGTTNAFIYTDKGLEYDFTYYYWVRFVSTSSTPGPWSNMASATTIENIAATMAALSETLAGLPGYSLLSTGAVAATVIKQSSAPSTRADGSALSTYDFWLDTDDNQMYIRNAANSAWVAGRDSTLVSLYGATSYTGSTITSAMASAQADIVTVTNAQTATASSLSTLSSTVTNNNNTLTSSVNTLSTTTANINGDLDAMYVINVATESNGSKSAAGMVIGSNANSGSGATSYVQFRADTFAIWNPSTTSTVAPFIITDNVVYIDTARIKDAAILDAKIGTLNGGKIIADTITATQIAANTITATQILADTITATQIAANTITAAEILANTITADEINVDTLNVKHFDNVSTDIKSHLSAGTFFPLGRSAQNFVERASAYTGSTGSFVPVTITEIRNGATYIAIFSGVLGNVSGGVVQYSLDNSTWVNADGNTNIYWNAGTYRGYTYVYTGEITGLSTSQSTVYWRVYFSGGYNHTQLSLNIIMDNTQ
jgi:hypothetical protein